MKTVTGKLLSSSPISVSKAAKIITIFAATDNGASQAISAYLRRASASFIELKQLHREILKPIRSDRNHNKSKSETTVEDAQESTLEPSLFNSTRGDVELSQEASQGYGDGERKKHKKKNKEKGDGGGQIVIENRESKREEEKNEGKMLTEHKKEKRGKKIETLVENGVKIEKGKMRDEEEREGDNKKKKNKRKSRDIEDQIENNASSEPRKKKKKKS